MQFLLRAVLSVCLAISVPLCANAEGFPVRDIRKVVVSGDADVPRALLKRTDAYLKRAANATRRAVTLDRASMDVRVTRVTQSANGASSAQVTVTLSDVKGGVSARNTLTVNSFMPSARGRDAALGDAIAKRVAIAYRLAPVSAGKLNEGKRPAKGRKYAGGKRKPAVQKPVKSYSRRDNRPLVIPTEAALTVRSRALADGSTGKVAPCVVTQTISCD
nr:hypothetical protein [uncultured Shinella sp.]